MPDEERQTAEEPTYSPDGVDLTLIHWMLSMTPAERLETLQRFADCLPLFRQSC